MSVVKSIENFVFREIKNIKNAKAGIVRNYSGLSGISRTVVNQEFGKGQPRFLISCNNFSTKRLTKNIVFYTEEKTNIKFDEKSLRLKERRDNPLVVIPTWLGAKKRHLDKFVELYTEQGFDVLTAQITPWQLAFPNRKNGACYVAQDVLHFLHHNDNYSNIVIHLVSVGGFTYTELLRHFRTNEKYLPISGRIRAQVIDSLIAPREMAYGTAYTVFPWSKILQWPVQRTLEWHNDFFKKSATFYYDRAEAEMHTNCVKTPALFLCTKTDIFKSNLFCEMYAKAYAAKGVPVTWQCWNDGPHAGLLGKYREEYIKLVFDHLRAVNLLRN